MPDLHFEIISAKVKAFAAVPTIVFHLQLTNLVENEEVYAAALRCQLMIAAIKRPYDPDTKERLLELFGEPSRWQETMRNLFWTVIAVPVPKFVGKTIIEVPLACGEEMSAASGKYFHSVRDGLVPLAFLFSGTVFYKSPEETLQVMQVPWEKEATFELPVALWKETMDTHFPDSRWLRIRQDIFDRLVQYKAISDSLTLETCLESLVDEALTKARNMEMEKT